MYQGKEYLLKDRTYGTNFLTSIFSVFLTSNPPENKTLGTDFSHWQSTNDFMKMKSKGIKFGITKATDVGSSSKEGFVDSKAIENYLRMKEAELLRGAYHWLDPHAYTTPEYQAYYYLNNFYFKHPTEIRPVLDFEDRDVISYNDMLWRAQVWLEIVKKETGRTPIVYTSPGYMMSFDKSKTGFLFEYPLWVAHYIARSYPTIPYPWTEYVMWQYSDRGHYPYYNQPSTGSFGKDWGAGSHFLDMNYFDGTYFDLLSFCEIEEPVNPPLPPVIDPIKPLFQAKCIVGLLNVRKGVGTTNPVVRTLKLGDIVNVYEEKNNWFAISPNKNEWVSGHSNYMQKITDPITPPVEPVEPIEPTEPLKKLYYPCDERWPITQYFGQRPHVYTQSKGHNGVDFGTPVGNPLYAAWDGLVKIAEKRTYGYGAVVYIQHSHGITIYGHMSRIDVKVGDRVKAKQVIGLSGGATNDPYGGMTTGPHLHFEYRWDITAPQVPGGYKYNAVDPLPLLISHEPDGEALYQIEVIVTALNVRTGPGTGFNALYTIKRGEKRFVYEEKDGWVRIGNGRWCSGHPTYIKKLGDVPVEPPQPPSPSILFKAKCIVTALNVRDSAGIDGKILWQLKNGNIVNVYELKNGWYRISESKQEWCSGNSSYMIKL